MLMLTLPHLRNISGCSALTKVLEKSSYYETELIHNLASSIFEPDFVEHDIWFLNHQAKTYCRECSEKKSHLYQQQVQSIRELFALVPETMKDQLDWAGPIAKSKLEPAGSGQPM